MKTQRAFSYEEWPMKRKLFAYMLILGAILIISFFIGLLIFGNVSTPERTMSEALGLQMSVYEKDVLTHFEYIAAAGINLSEDMSFLMNRFLSARNISFDDLADNEELIRQLQNEMISPMRQSLLQEDCSGIFVVWDTTVNSHISYSNESRTGMYLQINGYETANPSVLLYRGLSDVGKNNNIMPHRKWNLEINTDMFDEYFSLKDSSTPYDEAYVFSSIDRLPGTSESAMHLIVPVRGSDDVFYGICGFEISESYFMTYHAQPSSMAHLSCLLSEFTESGAIEARRSFSCGVLNGYYRAPGGVLTYSKAGKDLYSYKGDSPEYIGITKKISLSPNNKDHLLSVMVLKSDYDSIRTTSLLKNSLLVLLLLFFTVTCSMFFSKRFISPILKAIDEIKTDSALLSESTVPEINDLFEFLSKKDTLHEKDLNALTQKTEDYLNEINRLESEYEKAKAEIARLAYSRKQEVDPENYKLFLEGINTLTPTERKIFGYYLSGLSVKEILETAKIKESTLRFHNQNIYSKLGVNSLKQLLRYAALMENEE
ncbi:MAG: hypothetical protein IKM61_09480 [Eubacteriaceae bacterium]|nr:hypothetical protein [Eubacteriaceae bacterium]